MSFFWRFFFPPFDFVFFPFPRARGKKKKLTSFSFLFSFSFSPPNPNLLPLYRTTSVERSELLSEALTNEGIPHQLLNAKPEFVEREAEVVAQAGRKGRVTISTNMAGRGTDILLGGNAEYMARLKLREALMPAVVSQVENLEAAAGKGGGKEAKKKQQQQVQQVATRARPVKSWAASPDLFPCELSPATQKLISDGVAKAVEVWGTRSLPELEAEERLAFACERAPSSDEATLALRAAFRAAETEFEALTSAEKAEVVALGGLHVIGTERHESRRIDNQLRGRAGRQGDPGSARYFLSLEDNLFRVFGGDRIKGLMSAFQIEDLPIESKMLTDALNEAQRKVEAYFYDIRRQLWEFDQVLNTQRDRLYAERRRALLATSLDSLFEDYARRTVDDILEANVDPTALPETWNLEALAAKVGQYCAAMGDETADSLMKAAGGVEAASFEKLREHLRTRGVAAYRARVEAVNALEPGLMDDAQRFFVLVQTDNLWKEHLMAMKFLQQAVGLRGYAQRDPLAEYKLEGYQLFVEMMAQIRRNAIYNVYVFDPKKAAESKGSGGGGGGAKKEEAKAPAAAAT